MIHPEDRLAIYNNKVRRVASFKEVVEFLQLDGIGEQGPQGIQGLQGERGDKETKVNRVYRDHRVLQDLKGLEVRKVTLEKLDQEVYKGFKG